MARAGKQSGYTHTEMRGPGGVRGARGPDAGCAADAVVTGCTPRLCSRCYLNSEEHKLRRVT